jgi:dTDP-4-dehydrorhamnose 3,5-epimerase-like enzyme/SAM-dependent methyltransferase
MTKKNLFEYIVKGKDTFFDKRGKIENYKLTEKINLVATISSKPNTMRSNHYHPIQQQKCLLINGQYISIYKDLKKDNSPRITQIVNEGDLVVTEPLVAHTMVFIKQSLFLNLVNGEREHKNFGKTHTIPIKLVSEEEKNYLFNNYKLKCRVCDNKDLKRILSLGFQPLANNLSKKKDNQKSFPLELNICNNCKNVQLSIVPNFEKLFSKYLYKSSIGQSFSNHFIAASNNYIKNFKLKKNSFIIDVGSNDGVGLMPFKNKGFNNLLGIEPAKNLANVCKKKGIKILNEFLTYKSINKIKKKADLILASNVFAHADNLREMASCMLKLLKHNGKIIIEVQYLPQMLQDLTFDNIYHEHVNYWSLTTLVKFFSDLNCNVYKSEIIQTHGGSIRVYISKNLGLKKDKSIKKQLLFEKRLGILKDIPYENFENKILLTKENFLKNIKFLKKKYKKIIGYGAPAKATTALNYFGIKDNLITKVIDDNLLKINKFIPGTNIKIVSSKSIRQKQKCILVLAWNMFDEIKSRNNTLSSVFINIRDLYEKDFIKKFLSNKLY